MFVFKYGGHAIPEGASVDPSIEYLAKLIKSGVKLVVVHGGGPQINRELEIHGIKSEMIDGYRKTTPEVFEVVQRTLSGEVLRNLTNQFISQGINAVGISAGDGNLIRAKNVKPELGLVGVVSAVNPELLKNLMAQGITPVISPIAVNSEGMGMNMNADLIAGAIGGALGAEAVLFSTDVSGIYRNWPDETSLIESINSKELSSIAISFEGGMIPKAQAAINAIESGAKSVRIFVGRKVANVIAAFEGKAGTLVLA
jgi:acetylglutamate kinase